MKMPPLLTWIEFVKEVAAIWPWKKQVEREDEHFLLRCIAEPEGIVRVTIDDMTYTVMRVGLDVPVPAHAYCEEISALLQLVHNDLKAALAKEAKEQ